MQGFLLHTLQDAGHNFPKVRMDRILDMLDETLFKHYEEYILRRAGHDDDLQDRCSLDTKEGEDQEEEEVEVEHEL